MALAGVAQRGGLGDQSIRNHPPPEEVGFAVDSPLEGGVSCELVSGNPDFNVRKKENGRPKAKFDQYLDLVERNGFAVGGGSIA